MFFINPFIYGGPAGDFESIATVTVGSGGASSIEFTSIPGTYQHLHLRLLLRSARAAVDANVTIQVNGDTGSNYNWHILTGDGASAAASNPGGAGSNIQYFTPRPFPGANATASIFGAATIDILDYASTNKYKTTRSLAGTDRNGAGVVGLYSGLWMSTSAITSLKLTDANAANFVQHSTAALYGIKAP